MINLNSDVKEFKDLIKALNPCQEGPDWIDLVEDGKPYKEIFKNVDKGFREEWAFFVISHVGKYLTEQARLPFINLIQDSMYAFVIYLMQPYLTEQEDALLKSKFEEKLPTAEKELLTKKIERLKKWR